MAKIGLFYGSNEGHTETVAERMKAEFDKYVPGEVELRNIAQATNADMVAYEYLIYGLPTWNIGELQDDWAVYFPEMDNLDLKGKKLAMFGLGDQYNYSATFIDGVGIIAIKAMERGAELLAPWPRDEYQFEDSKALMEDGWLMGMACDEDNEAHLTQERIEVWVKWVLENFGMLEPEGA